jgi:hypothetical protein
MQDEATRLRALLVDREEKWVAHAKERDEAFKRVSREMEFRINS